MFVSASTLLSAAYSVCSPPPCGEGLGVGVVQFFRRRRHHHLAASPPLPNPPPQGGREQTEFAACADSIPHEHALETRRRAMPMNAPLRSFIAAMLMLAGGSLLVTGARAAEPPRVGNAVPEAFSFVPLDLGMRKGLFANNGLDIESIASAGDARMQQAMASDSLDVALGSGPAMAFIVKGAPIKAVAAMAGPPLLLAIVV